MNKIPIYFIVMLLLIGIASATCTVTLDKTEYIVGESALAIMICDSAAESNKAYTLTWYNGSSTLETDLGTTPGSPGIQFFESFTIDKAYSTGVVNMTGANLEGEDTFTSTQPANNTLVISNIKLTSNILLGKLQCVDFDLALGNNSIENVFCSLDIHDLTGIPIAGSITPTQSFNSHVVMCQQVRNDALEEDMAYAADIDCAVQTNDFVYSATSAEFELHVGHWLISSTLTDKTQYTLADKQISVCATLTNNQSKRIPIEITYNYRCGTPDTATDRIVVDSHTEIRGISANTTQNQCALLEIKNLKTMTNQINVCYAATDVRVLAPDMADEYLTIYPTTSANFNITSSSGVIYAEDPDKMSSLSITIFILFCTIIFLVVPLIVKKFSENTIANMIITRSFWVIALYLMVMNSAIIASIAAVAGFDTVEIFRYMWIFGTAGYLLMVVTMIKTIFDIIEEWKRLANEKRGIE